MILRFVVIATMRRGRLKRPQVLEDADQWRAFSAWREDESRRVRAEYEARMLRDTRVIWSKARG